MISREELRGLAREQLAFVFEALSENGVIVRKGEETGRDERRQPTYGPAVEIPARLLIVPHEPKFREVVAQDSRLEVPAFDVYAPWDAPLDMPGFTLRDAAGLVYEPIGDAQDVGLTGLRAVWLVGVRAPKARST